MASQPWSNSSPSGVEELVRRACLPSMASNDWYANKPKAHRIKLQAGSWKTIHRDIQFIQIQDGIIWAWILSLHLPWRWDCKAWEWRSIWCWWSSRWLWADLAPRSLAPSPQAIANRVETRDPVECYPEKSICARSSFSTACCWERSPFCWCHFRYESALLRRGQLYRRWRRCWVRCHHLDSSYSNDGCLNIHNYSSFAINQKQVICVFSKVTDADIKIKAEMKTTHSFHKTIKKLSSRRAR